MRAETGGQPDLSRRGYDSDNYYLSRHIAGECFYRSVTLWLKLFRFKPVQLLTLASVKGTEEPKGVFVQAG